MLPAASSTSFFVVVTITADDIAGMAACLYLQGRLSVVLSAGISLTDRTMFSQ